MTITFQLIWWRPPRPPGFPQHYKWDIFHLCAGQRSVSCALSSSWDDSEREKTQKLFPGLVWLTSALPGWAAGWEEEKQQVKWSLLTSSYAGVDWCGTLTVLGNYEILRPVRRILHVLSLHRTELHYMTNELISLTAFPNNFIANKYRLH